MDINIRLYRKLIKLSKETLETIINDSKEFDKAFIPYLYCFIVHNTERKTLLKVYLDK